MKGDGAYLHGGGDLGLQALGRGRLGLHLGHHLGGGLLGLLGLVAAATASAVQQEGSTCPTAHSFVSKARCSIVQG